MVKTNVELESIATQLKVLSEKLTYTNEILFQIGAVMQKMIK